MTHLRRFVVAAGISSALIGSGTALAAVGDRVATIQLPQFAIGVGIAFDGVRLYYTSGEHLLSFEPGNPAGTLTSVLVNDGTDGIALNAMSYDRTRGVLWGVRHDTDLIYTVNRVTGAATFVLPADDLGLAERNRRDLVVDRRQLHGRAGRRRHDEEL